MHSRMMFWKWSAIGLVVGVFLVWAQIEAVGGLAGLLQVGERSGLRPLIEEQLGSMPLAGGRGHDGQSFYAIGLDLDGDVVGAHLDHAAYRYRRILFPLVASFFGVLDGWALLYASVGLGVAAMAVSTGVVASMATSAGKSEWLALVVVLNPGVWLSVQLVTSDALGLALMIVGLQQFLIRRDRSAVWFALSALAKDVFLATAVALGVRYRAWRVLLLPAGALLAWMTFLTLQLGGGFSSRGNLTWPFLGILGASSNWPNLDRTELAYLVVAILTVAVGVVFCFRDTWLRWPLVTWSALALISSHWIWNFGNNAVRAFAPILVLVALSTIAPTTAESTVGSGSLTPRPLARRDTRAAPSVDGSF